MRKCRLIFSMVFTLLTAIFIHAQTWENVGSSDVVSAGSGAWNNLVVDVSGNYHVSYYDLTVAKGSVQKFDGTVWSYLGGSAGVSTATATYNSLSTDLSGNIYYTNQSGYPNTGMEVRKYSNSSWTLLSNPIASTINYQASAVSSSGVLFIYSNENSGTVKRYVNSAWEQVGTGAIAGSSPTNTEMVIGSDNTVYICHNASGVRVYANSATAANTDAWTLVGGSSVGTTFTEGANATSDFAIDANNNLYVVYSSNAAANRRLNVMKYNGVSWSQLGDANFGISNDLYNVAIAVTPAGKPYVVASGWAINDGKNTVYQLNETTNTWETLGGSFVSDGAATYNDLAYDNVNDYLVLTYSQGGIHVKRFSLETPPVIDVENVSVSTEGGVDAQITTNGGILQLDATVTPTDAPQEVVWSIQSGSAFASVDANGLVTAIANGTATIRAASTENTAVYDEIEIAITNQVVPVVALEVSTQGGVDAQITTNGGTLQLDATVTPSDASPEVVWSVQSGSDFASVDAEGLVTAIANGTVTVRATSTENTAVYDEIEISITNQVVPVVALEISTQGGVDAQITTDGGTLQLEVTVTPSDASSEVVWSVQTGSDFASVDANGLVTAIANGTATIRATSTYSNAVYDEIEIIVNIENNCVPLEAFVETFDEFTSFPDMCWAASTVTMPAMIGLSGTTDKVVQLYSYTSEQPIYIVTPEISTIDGQHVLKFDVISVAGTGIQIQTGTLASQTDFSGFTAVEDAFTPVSGATYTTPAIPAQEGHKYAAIKFIPNGVHKVIQIDNVEWRVKNTAGVADFTQNQIKIYPNPTLGLVNVDGVSDDSEISIFNTLGQKIISVKSVNQVDLSSFSNGIYVLEVKMDQRVVSVQKIEKK